MELNHGILERRNWCITMAGTLHIVQMRGIFNMFLTNMHNKRAQSLSEYAIVIGLVVAMVASMQIFLKRRMQAVLHDSISEFGNPDYVDEPEDTQYEFKIDLHGLGGIGL